MVVDAANGESLETIFPRDATNECLKIGLPGGRN
jgi:hypothetical protein